MKWPFYCEYVETRTRVVRAVQYVNKARIIEDCCDHYERVVTDNGERCVPSCHACIHGTCVAPLTCTCDSGYHGEHCDKGI